MNVQVRRVVVSNVAVLQNHNPCFVSVVSLGISKLLRTKLQRPETNVIKTCNSDLTLPFFYECRDITMTHAYAPLGYMTASHSPALTDFA